MFWDQEPGKARRGEHAEAKHDRILMVSKRRGAGLIAIAVIALFISLDPPRQYFLPEPIALGCLLFFGWCFLSHLGVWDFAAFILQDEPDRFSCGMSYKKSGGC